MEDFCEFLIEIGTEEIPARMQLHAEKTLKDLFEKTFSEFSISFKDIESFITPRRQVIKGYITKTTKESIEEKRGPKENAPEAALSGFLKSSGLEHKDLILKDGYYYAYLKKTPLITKDLIPEILEKVLKSMPWPKVMRYPNATLSWVRPIRSLLCLFDQEPIEFDIPYLGIKTTSHVTGHRFMGGDIKAVSSKADYMDFLNKSYVMLSHKDRQNTIRQSLLDFAEKNNIVWIEDIPLLEEVSGLVEYPFPFFGKIDVKFMHLPSSVLSTSMRVHQKYFAFKQKENDTLAPYFGVIANFSPKDPTTMLKGFEKVLRARLSDATFFYEVDLKIPLAEYFEKLDKIIYHNQLGSLKDKLERLKNNTFFDHSPLLDQAIHLSKSDLLTQMVGEFPELQGKMGNIYAKAQGLSEDVALALEEYYLPEGPKDDLPQSDLASKLSLLDKMDALVGFIKIGLKPSGSKDPFALRRQALGVIRILMTESYKNLDLLAFIRKTMTTYQASEKDGLLDDIKEFILDRFSNLMQSEFSATVVASVLKTVGSEGLFLNALQKRIAALDQFLKTPEGDLLKALHKRAIGVLNSNDINNEINESLLEEDGEKKLHEALKHIDKEILLALSQEDYQKIMILLTTLQKDVSLFFDTVLINVENAALKHNRQALLKRFINNIHLVCDLTLVQ